MGKLKAEGRAENNQAMKDIKEYIEEMEGVKLDEINVAINQIKEYPIIVVKTE